jgi:two-component system, NarL family, nitrate/nitrite response regulator NarL
MERMNSRISVLVADDSRTAMTSVCRFLESDGRFEIIGTASNGVQLLRQSRNHCPDLVLVDLSMPQMNGFEAAIQLRKLFPDLRILIFSGLSGASLEQECMRSGANGFVEKGLMPEKLLQEVSRLFPDVRSQN